MLFVDIIENNKYMLVVCSLNSQVAKLQTENILQLQILLDLNKKNICKAQIDQFLGKLN